MPFNSSKNEYFESHVFLDNSKEVAAAAVYQRIESGDECCNFVAVETALLSQSKVARNLMPRKKIIPLDLGTRLLRKCLNLTTLIIQNFEL